jgi:hypothetical protein
VPVVWGLISDQYTVYGLRKLPIEIDGTPASPAETRVHSAEDKSHVAEGCAGCAIIHELAARKERTKEDQD